MKEKFLLRNKTLVKDQRMSNLYATHLTAFHPLFTADFISKVVICQVYSIKFSKFSVEKCYYFTNGSVPIKF